MTSGPISRKRARLVYGCTNVSTSRTARLLSGGIKSFGPKRFGRDVLWPWLGGALAFICSPIVAIAAAPQTKSPQSRLNLKTAAPNQSTPSRPGAGFVRNNDARSHRCQQGCERRFRAHTVVVDSTRAGHRRRGPYLRPKRPGVRLQRCARLFRSGGFVAAAGDLDDQ